MKPKSIHSAVRYTLVALSAGILVACGGGGGSGGSFSVADGGIRGTGSSVGPVSGFGSVFVNGVQFDTSDLNGQVTGDDGITFEENLDEGMILRVDGEWRENGEGTAESVEYDDTLRGPISWDSNLNLWDESLQIGTISILGLDVNIDRQTVIKTTPSTQDLQQGDVVRVSGWRLADGSFRASLVRVHSGDVNDTAFDLDYDTELEGQIYNLNLSPACSFEIGTVTVLCNSLDIESPLGPDDLVEGAFFEIEGNLDMTATEVTAGEIRQDDIRRYRRGIEDDIEFSGTVTEEFNDSTNTFGLNGITVNLLIPGTEFDDDLRPEDLVLGLLIQVEGDYLSDDTVNADEIELREANAQVEGSIDGSINKAEGTFTVGGVRVQVTPLTLIEDDDDDSELTRDELFDLLTSGDELEIEGIERGSGTDIFLEALQIEREEDGSEGQFGLEGKLRAVTDNSITVLGVEMEVDFNALGCTSDELQELIDDQDGRFPIVEVDYEPTNTPGLFSYVATEIESDDDQVPEVECDD